MPLPAFIALLLGLLALVLAAYLLPAAARVVAPALLAGALGLIIAWRWPLAVLALMLAFTPLYDGLVRYLTYVAEWPAGRLQMLSLWKEGGLLLLFAVVLMQHWTGRRRQPVLYWRHAQRNRSAPGFHGAHGCVAG